MLGALLDTGIGKNRLFCEPGCPGVLSLPLAPSLFPWVRSNWQHPEGICPQHSARTFPLTATSVLKSLNLTSANFTLPQPYLCFLPLTGAQMLPHTESLCGNLNFPDIIPFSPTHRFLGFPEVAIELKGRCGHCGGSTLTRSQTLPYFLWCLKLNIWVPWQNQEGWKFLFPLRTTHSGCSARGSLSACSI